MNDKFVLTGGAKIGIANASFPLAKLQVDKDTLRINASIVGNLVFQPKDIISITSYSTFLSITNGIKINHNVENYKKEVIFWTFKSPESVINSIKETGFFVTTENATNLSETEIVKRQIQGGFPLKKAVVVFYVLVWNLLFLSDLVFFFLNKDSQVSPVGVGIKAAVGFLFLSTVLTLLSSKFQKMILKENRDFDDIKTFVYLLIFVTGFMLLGTVFAELLFE